ncbi:MAG: molybdate transporter substrate-binding protein [Herbaspirillum sp.]|nr:molybdate transporter substrate-binding protein [Herbaspirillum sp.]
MRARVILAGLGLALSLSAAGNALAGELIVSAASSLNDAFKAMAQAYQDQNPADGVVLNFAASDVLLQQIVSGAPADVFASADQVAMDKAVAQQAVAPASRHDFAGNQLVLIVPRDSVLPIARLDDLMQPALRRIAYGNPAFVPVGRYAQAALEKAGLWKAVSAKGVMAQNVRQSLDYVARGEVDAGFVFATDAAMMPDKVHVVLRLPASAAAPITYPIAVTSRSTNAAAAARFIAYVRSDAGQAILARYGFLPPASVRP